MSKSAKGLFFQKASINAFSYSSIATIVTAILQLCQMLILVRFISLDTLGMAALVMALLTILNPVADMGLNKGIVHFQHTSTPRLAALFWLSFGAALGFGLFFMGLHPIINTFYTQEIPLSFMVLIAISIPISTLSSQARYRAEQHLNYAPLAKVEIYSAIVTLVCSSLAAYCGMGLYTFSIIALTHASAMLALSLLLLPTEYWVIKQPDFTGLKRHFTFGKHATVGSIISGSLVHLDLIVASMLFSPSLMGAASVMRNLGLRVAYLVNPIILRVGYALLSQSANDQMHREQNSDQHIYDLVFITAFVNFTLYFFVILHGNTIVQLLLGSDWLQWSYLLKLYAVWGCVRSLCEPIAALGYASGATKTLLKWNIYYLFGLIGALALLTLTPTLTSYIYGIIAFQALIMIALWKWFIRKINPISFQRYLTSLTIPFSLTLMIAVVGAMASYHITISSDFNITDLVNTPSHYLYLTSHGIFHLLLTALTAYIVIRRFRSS